ncbi:hypothetical protein D3C71_1260050 [compost metagenome]
MFERPNDHNWGVPRRLVKRFCSGASAIVPEVATNVRMKAATAAPGERRPLDGASDVACPRVTASMPNALMRNLTAALA